MKSATKKTKMQAITTDSKVKNIPIAFHEKQKVTDDDLVEGEQPKNIRPLSTLDLIRTVVKKEDAPGPDGRQKGFTGEDQYRIYRILGKIDDLPKDATSLELHEKDHAFIVRKLKGFEWVRYDKFFLDFELSMGISFDDK